MTQSDIIKFLKKNEGWHTFKDIAKGTKLLQGTVQTNLKNINSKRPFGRYPELIRRRRPVNRENGKRFLWEWCFEK